MADRCTQFCEWCILWHEDDENVYKTTVYFDAATFKLNGTGLLEFWESFGHILTDHIWRQLITSFCVDWNVWWWVHLTLLF